MHRHAAGESKLNHPAYLPASVSASVDTDMSRHGTQLTAGTSKEPIHASGTQLLTSYQLVQRAGSMPNAAGLQLNSCSSPIPSGALSDPECKAPPRRYHSKRRRARITVKVPHADMQLLPAIAAHTVQAQLQQAHGQDAAVHVQRLSMRPGCVVVELDLVYQDAATASIVGSDGTLDAATAALAPAAAPAAVPAVAPAAIGTDASRCPIANELAELLQLQHIIGASEGQLISVAIDDKVSLVRWDPVSRVWVVVPTESLPPSMSAQVPAASLQIPPMCMTLDQQLVRVSLALSGETAQGCTFEAVSGGMPLPCTVISDSRQKSDVNAEGIVVLELDLGVAVPGVARCNVWSAPRPVSCLLATQPLLLLPAGCTAAAAELSHVPASAGQSTVNDLYADIGELLQLQLPEDSTPGVLSRSVLQPEAQAVTMQPLRPLVYLSELAEAAQGILEWCHDARCPATAQLVALQVPVLDGLIARSLASETPTAVSLSPAAPTPGLAAGPLPQIEKVAAAATVPTPSPAPAADAAEACAVHNALAPTPAPTPAPAPSAGSFIKSFAAAVRSVDAALPLRRRQLQVSALPPTLWAILVLMKCLAASARSMIDGTGAPELVALAMWGWPYVLILAAQTMQRRPASPSGSTASAALPASSAHALARLGGALLPYVRVFLHLHRSLIVAMMGLGYLRIPFVFSITSAGVDVPAKALYMAMEAYDYRVAILVILLTDIPAFFFLYTRLNVPDALLHVVALGVLGVAMQLGMQWWRKFIDAPRRKTA